MCSKSGVVPDPSMDGVSVGGECQVCDNGDLVDLQIQVDPSFSTSRDPNDYGREGDGEIHACENETVTVFFSANYSISGGSCEPEFSWDFGDAGVSSERSPSHEYNEPGLYTVSLNVDCSSMCSISENVQVEITGRTLDDIEDDYMQMVSGARVAGLDFAADNMEYFLSGAGGAREVSANFLRGYDSVNDAVSVNLSRFEPNIDDIISILGSGQSQEFTDFWDRTETASILTEPDLYYGSGTFTVTSTGEFDIERSSDDVVSIVGSVNHRWGSL
jgi:PKD repeat protein